MKVYSFFEKYVLVLLGILVFASCSDDDNAGVMSSKVMLNQELVASNYSFIWNGVTSPRKDDVKAKFRRRFYQDEDDHLWYRSFI